MSKDTETSDSNEQIDNKEHSVSSTSSLPYMSRLPAVDFLRSKWPAQKPQLTNIVPKIFIVIIVCVVVGFGAGWLGAGFRSNPSNNEIFNGTLSPQKEVVTSESQLITSIAQTVGPSVVSVNVTSTTSSPNANGLLGLEGLPETEQSAGTGIILTSAGLVITNRHVVPEGTTSVSVTLSDGSQLNNVSVLGETSQNSSLDIAFLKINNPDGHTLIPAVLGNSSSVQVGESVVAIGNALGQYQNTVTSGIISGYGRSVQASDANSSQGTENLEDLFQTDAAINEGNSGGPLVNMNGQVIGINTAIASGAQNIGFAIPINDVKGLIQQVESTGKLQQPYLGVYYIPLTSDLAQQYNLSVSRGAWIPPSSVLGQDPIIAGGPAANAGLKGGDIITQVGGTSVDQNNSLTALINQDQVGQTVNLTVIRKGKTIHVNVTLAAEPAGSTSS
ncbi:MAG: S1C family serine protease [Candidatus Saccharimonadales bacterium]